MLPPLGRCDSARSNPRRRHRKEGPRAPQGTCARYNPPMDPRARLVERVPALVELAQRHGVQRLDLFGSAARGEARAGSDVDVLVVFEPSSPAVHAERYFGLLEELEALLGAPVELVEEKAISNPYLLEAVARDRVPIYEAGG